MNLASQGVHFSVSEQNFKRSWRERSGIYFIDPVNNMTIKLFRDKTFSKSVVR